MHTYSFLIFLVHELQQDIRELSQADLSEVDPEENSAEFMGILIKVHTILTEMLSRAKITCLSWFGFCFCF